MRPTTRVATTGEPPRSRRKAAVGTRATAILALWTKEEGENREFFMEELAAATAAATATGSAVIKEEWG
ncbi:UNVERIFIED_CONTAM: hypothetical protein Sradi_4799900 [Sesamum radiatum]|uniref:Uncharacterized protein n=1 Tax=Sesamum radiatum TaxID=300843 RepID=A0AAW2MWF2_SESRA